CTGTRLICPATDSCSSCTATRDFWPIPTGSPRTASSASGRKSTPPERRNPIDHPAPPPRGFLLEAGMAPPKTAAWYKMLIQVGDGADPEVFSAPCGLTTRGLNFSAETSDTTVPDCDDPSLPSWT